MAQIGTILDIRVHREGDSIYLDSFDRVFMNLGEVPFNNGDAIVEKNDVTGTVDDSYRVRFLYEEGEETGGSMRRNDLLLMAMNAIANFFDGELDGVNNKIA